MSKRRNSSTYRVWMNERVYVEPRLVPSHMLKLDLNYQRKVDMERVQEIVDNFNHCIVNPLKVSHRDGQYFVFDGGHTLMALKYMNKDKDSFPVECRVYENLTYEEENQLFAMQTGYAKPISVKNEMKALQNAKDQETLDIVQATEDTGLNLAIRENTEGSIRAIGKARNLYRKYGEDIYSAALSLIRETWGGKSSSLTANMLGGVCVFLKEFGSEYSYDRFLRKLKEKNPVDIRTMAKRGKTEYQTMDAAVATEIAGIYNYGGGKGRIDPVRASRIVEY